MIEYLNNRKYYRWILFCCAVFILYLATTPRSIPVAEELSDKFNHFIAFVVLSFLADRAFEYSFTVLAIPVLFFGVAIEFIQFFLPYRQFSVFDMFANGVGILIYFVMRFVFVWVRRGSEV